MKKMIILLLSILGIVVAAVAFDKAVEKNPVEVNPEKTLLAPQWFNYVGPDSSDPNYEDEILDQENYDPIEGTPSCEEGDELCSVFADRDGDHPSESDLQTLKDQILKNTPQNINQVRFLE